MHMNTKHGLLFGVKCSLVLFGFLKSMRLDQHQDNMHETAKALLHFQKEVLSTFKPCCIPSQQLNVFERTCKRIGRSFSVILLSIGDAADSYDNFYLRPIFSL